MEPTNPTPPVNPEGQVPEQNQTPQTDPMPPTQEAAPQPAPAPAQQGNQSQKSGLTGAWGLFGPSRKAWNYNTKTIVLLSLTLAIPFVILGMMAAAQIAAHEIPSAEGTPTTALNAGSVVMGIISVVLIIFLALVLQAALVKVQLCSVRGQKISVKEAFDVGKKFWLRMVGLMLAMWLLICVGLLLLIVPGLIFIRRYFLSAYYLVDKDLSISEAMKQSAENSKNSKVWGLIGVQFVIGAFSFIPLVGSLVTLILQVLYYFAPAIRYDEVQKLNGATSAAAPQAPAPQYVPATV